jgi:hypothetical protein
MLGVELDAPEGSGLLTLDGSSSWLFAGTEVRVGHRLQVLLHSPVQCRGASFADATYYTARSGAGVFASGTSSWVCQLSRACATTRRSAVTAAVVRAVTVNLLRPTRLAPHPPPDP